MQVIEHIAGLRLNGGSCCTSCWHLHGKLLLLLLLLWLLQLRLDFY
jgi:hypothetical protein